MKIRIFDKFDNAFTCVIWENVDFVDNGTVFFQDGSIGKFDTEFCDYEILIDFSPKAKAKKEMYDYVICENLGKFSVKFSDGMTIVDDLTEKELNDFFENLEE